MQYYVRQNQDGSTRVLLVQSNIRYMLHGPHREIHVFITYYCCKFGQFALFGYFCQEQAARCSTTLPQVHEAETTFVGHERCDIMLHTGHTTHGLHIIISEKTVVDITALMLSVKKLSNMYIQSRNCLQFLADVFVYCTWYVFTQRSVRTFRNLYRYSTVQ